MRRATCSASNISGGRIASRFPGRNEQNFFHGKGTILDYRIGRSLPPEPFPLLVSVTADANIRCGVDTGRSAEGRVENPRKGRGREGKPRRTVVVVREMNGAMFFNADSRGDSAQRSTRQQLGASAGTEPQERRNVRQNDRADT